MVYKQICLYTTYELLTQRGKTGKKTETDVNNQQNGVLIFTTKSVRSRRKMSCTLRSCRQMDNNHKLTWGINMLTPYTYTNEHTHSW